MNEWMNDQLHLKNIPSYGTCIFTGLPFICLLISLENQMMKDRVLCILKLSMSIFQSCFNRHSVLTHLAQWGPISAVTAIWTYTSSLVTCNILCTLSTFFPTVLAIEIISTSWKTKSTNYLCISYGRAWGGKVKFLIFLKSTYLCYRLH